MTPKPIRPPVQGAIRAQTIAEPDAVVVVGMSESQARSILSSPYCQCSRSKNFGHAVCGDCWEKLSAELQKDLYRRIGWGFENAYLEAMSVLGAKPPRAAGAHA